MRRARGFTLIEILVAMFVLALVAGLTSLAIDRSGERQARHEVMRMAELLSALRDEAEATGKVFGMVLEASAYSVLVLDPADRRWAAPADARLAAREVLGGGRQLQMQDASPAGWWPVEPGKNPLVEDRDAGDPEPAIIVLPSGEITAFRIRLVGAGSDAAAFEIRCDGVGEILWERLE